MAKGMVLPTGAGYQGAKAPSLQVQNTSSLDQAHAHILLYGPTKIGKTTTANSLETDGTKNAIISTQPEEQLAHLKKNNTPYVRVTDAAQLDYVLTDPRKVFGKEFTTLVVDDLTEGIDMFVQKYEASSKDGRVAYRSAGKHVREILLSLLDFDFNVVATALERSITDDFNISWITPNLPPSIMDLVTSKFSFIFYILGNHNLLTVRDTSRRIMAGNRLPLDKVSVFSKEEGANLARLWEKFQGAIHA